jgi:hypothetical protein
MGPARSTGGFALACAPGKMVAWSRQPEFARLTAFVSSATASPSEVPLRKGLAV